MTKKSLQTWYNGGDITYSQKEMIKKYGIGDYYPEHELKDFRKIYYWNDILERNIRKLEDGCSFPNSLVYQMNFFSAWWNNNLIIFIDGEENNYWVKLIVYEMPYRKNGEIKMYEIFEVFSVDWICPGNLYEARSKAKEIERKLRNDNPIFGGVITPELRIAYFDDYNSWVFPVTYGIGGEEIKRIELRGSDFYAAKNNPDDYFKPLDIVKIFAPRSNGKWMVHSGIYLGSGKVCHLYVNEKRETVIADEDWDCLFKALTGADKMVRYHPVIPFKHKNKIIEHIAKSITLRNGSSSHSKISSVSPEYNSEYNINNNNCEHMVNKCVLGLDFSEYAEKRTSRYTRELDIPKKLGETNREFDRKYNYKGSISEIRGYGERASDIMRDGIKMDACIEVQPKTSVFKDMLREYLNRNK
ncbi:MAG: hypothetical protein MRERV_21c030 [Mycoplasmataceae bacterium RV_VA103A]|nr:MAG: hypothetical protein MRERV_21c030 [Mycoplasmataceae bacterium RV_VA103A]